MKRYLQFIFVILYSLICNAKYEKFYPKLNQLMPEAFHMLSEDEKIILAPINYKKDIEQGRKAVKHLASFMIELSAQKAIFPELFSHSDQKELFNEFSNQMINKRESIFSVIPINVIDLESATRRASQLLTEEQLNRLQYLPFKENPEKALEVLPIFADFVIEEIKSKQIKVDAPLEEFKINFINNKFKGLQALYN